MTGLTLDAALQQVMETNVDITIRLTDDAARVKRVAVHAGSERLYYGAFDADSMARVIMARLLAEEEAA